MGKITPRFFLAVFIFGLCLLSANTVLANTNYGPEKPLSEKQIKDKSFFVGFLLEEAPTITLVKSSSASCSDVNDGVLQVSASGGVSPYTYSWSGPNGFTGSGEEINNLAPGNYTVDITDANDEPASESFNVGFEDNIDPEVITQNITVQLDSNGEANITATQINNGSNDACGIADLSIDKTSFDCDDVGNNTVTLTVTDANGRTDSETAIVTVEDNINPQAITQDITVQLDASGSASITANQIDNGSNDACGIQSRSLDITGFDCNNIGANTVILTVTDNNGNQDSEKAIVTVEDNIDPTAIAQDITIQLDASGNASITANDIDNGSSDNCGIASLSIGETSFDCDDVGNNTVTLTVTDENGNESLVTAVVTVQDNIDPTAIAKDITIQLDASGNASITANDIDNDSSDNCGIAGLSIDKTSFDCDDVGNNIVTLTATDTNGNENSNTATVTVQDNIDPTAIAQDITIQLDASGNASITANDIDNGSSDNCGIAGLSIDKTSFDCDDVGNNTVTFTVTDNNGKASTDTATVKVEDNIKPILPTVNDITWGCEYTAEAPIAQDNCDGEIIGEPNPSTTFTETGSITWTFTDSSGNSSSLEQTITIKPLIAEIETTNINCYGFENGYAQVTASGGVGNLIYDWGSLSGSGNSQQNLAPGDYLVKVSDQNGCSAELPFTITQPDDLEMTTSPTSTPVSCFGGNDGSITAGTISGGTPDQNGNYQYSIDNETWNITGEFTNVEAGTHTIFVLDANNCALQVTVNVEEPDVLNATLNKTDVSCYVDTNNPPNGKISITNPTGGTSGYEYSIDGNTWQQVPEFTGLPEGTYSVYIRDNSVSNCKMLLQEITINQPSTPLEVSISKTRTTTFGSPTASATASPSGGTPGYSYEWRKYDDTNNLGSVFASTKNINNQNAGLYQVTVIDNNGCEIAQDLEIIDKVSVEIIASSICDNVNNELRTSRFSVNLDSIAGGVGPVTNFDFEWDFGEGAIPSATSGEGEIVVNYEFPGDKIITLTVTDNAEPRVTSSYTFNHYAGECFEDCGQSMNFDIDRNSFYIGDSNGNPINSNNCSQDVDKFLWVNIIKSSNAYALNTELVYTTTNSNGNTVQKKAIDCFGTKVEVKKNKYEWELIPTGNFKLFRIQANSNLSTDIDWECGNNFKIEGLSMRYVTNSKKDCGQTNKNACIGLSEEVGVSTPVIANYTKDDVLCFGENTGNISISTAGGIRPYQYSIDGDSNSNYVTENQFFNLPAGVYSDVWVKDNKGNKFQLPEIIINQPIELTVAEPSITQPQCFGGTGSARIQPTGGTPFEDGTYEYLWNDPNNQTTQEATGLTAGNYTVTVIDANGCQIIREVEITQPDQLTEADAGPDQNFNCGFNTTSLAGNKPQTGVGKWTIIDGPSGGVITDDTIPNSDFTGNPGTYTLAWMISHEDETCPTSDEVEITFVEDCSTLDFDGEDDHIYLGDNYGFTSGNFSIEAWIRPKSVNSIRTIISKRNSNDLSKGFDLIINSGAPTFRWGNKSVSTSHKITTDRWHHIAAIYQNSEVKLYVDGIRVGTAAAINPAEITTPTLIGAMYSDDTPDVPENYFHGWIEEVRLWKTAITEEQLRFLMNQRLKIPEKPEDINGSDYIEGEVLSTRDESYFQDSEGFHLDYNNKPWAKILWTELIGYLPLISQEPKTEGYIPFSEGMKPQSGKTPNFGTSGIPGELRNIETNQENTAPTPYESEATGNWHTQSSWDENWNSNSAKFWTFPNDKGIDNQTEINWNIAIQRDDLNSNNKDIKLLGLFSESDTELVMEKEDDEINSSGNELRITHYLKLNGTIDLNGESQLVQTEGSILAGSGNLERDQQGTASSYNYNYWSSPVVSNTGNQSYTIASVMHDGTDDIPQKLDIGPTGYVTYADGGLTVPRRISGRWLYKFRGDANQYSEWKYIGKDGTLLPGEGYTMKGTSGQADIKDFQNYTFRGFPNNGPISLSVTKDQNYLLGNPYPSAIDAKKFILDNLSSSDVNGATNTKNVFNGALYFWDHFGGQTHILREYVGGYATINLSGAVQSASSVDERINNNNAPGTKTPGSFIPVGQGFFVNTVLDPDLAEGINISGGNIIFNNGQRAFATEADPKDSQFLKPLDLTKGSKTIKTKDSRYKIRLNFTSPLGYQREILVTADSYTTNGFDLGYDALLNDNIPEDMFWLIKENKFVIQGVPNFNLDQRLPLGITIAEEKEFNIEIGELENVPDIIDIYLRDNSDSTYHDLRKESFKASLAAGEYQDLYEIVFHDVTSTREDKEPGEGPIDYYYSLDNREFVISNPELHKIEHINIYNIAGQLVDQHFGIPDVKEIHIPQKKSLSSAVYIVKVYTDAGDYAKKVIIRKD